jgi:phage portal protein BeeE
VFAAGSVLHRKFFHPTDDFYGLSPLQVAARYYRTDNLSADWNSRFCKNQARPSGALSRRRRSTIRHIRAAEAGTSRELRRREHGRSDDPRRRVRLETTFGLSPLEMDWLAGTRDARAHDLCGVFHIPPEKIGDPEHRTYNSMPEATRAMWMEAVLPMLDAMRDSYNSR